MRTTSQPPPRIVRYDPTSHSTFTECKRKFMYMNLRGLVPKLGDKYLDFGSAFHSAREHMKKGVPLDEAINIALAQYAESGCSKMPPRSMKDLEQAVRVWHRAYGDGRDEYHPLVSPTEGPAIEKPFALGPYSCTDKVEVLLCGKIDELAVDMRTERIIIIDAKTTSSKNYAEYQDGYAYSPQMHIYSWAVRTVAGLDYYPSVLIDGVFLDKTGPFVYRSQRPLEIRDYMVERVMKTVFDDISYISNQITNYGIEFPYSYNSCEGKYSVCPYKGACMQNGVGETMVINTLFNIREYDPQTF